MLAQYVSAEIRLSDSRPPPLRTWLLRALIGERALQVLRPAPADFVRSGVARADSWYATCFASRYVLHPASVRPSGRVGPRTAQRAGGGARRLEPVPRARRLATSGQGGDAIASGQIQPRPRRNRPAAPSRARSHARSRSRRRAADITASSQRLLRRARRTVGRFARVLALRTQCLELEARSGIGLFARWFRRRRAPR